MGVDDQAAANEPDYGAIDVPATPTTDEEIAKLPVLDLDAHKASAAQGSPSPPCRDECVPVVRSEWAKACEASSGPIEAHITHIPPLVPALYEDLRMVCPHGVVWHMQPTSEQIAEWVRDGVE